MNAARAGHPAQAYGGGPIAAAVAGRKDLRTHGNTDHAFGWSYLREAWPRLTRNCASLAAE